MISDQAIALPATKSPTRLLAGRLYRNRAVRVCLFVLLVVIAAAILAPLILPYDPQKMDVIKRLQGPSAAHWFGTDEFGRDVFTRTIYGARVSLAVSFMVVALASLLGILIGITAGYVRALDGALMRLTDALMAFPEILLAIALMAALGASMFNVVLALGIVYTPRIARVVRGATLVLRELQFIEAADALGASTLRIMVVHLIPNLLSPLIVQATFIFSAAILTEAALSFLGAGVPPTIPTWGNMIAASQKYIGIADWLILAPGLSIVITVLSLQMVGDGLRDALDPKLQRLV